MTTFSKSKTRSHKTAAFSFLPWVARLFGHGPLRGESDPLPLDRPEVLTAECLEGINQIVRRAAWQFLARSSGWKKLAICGSSHPVRLWEAELPPLRFSGWTITLLLKVYNATRNQNNFNASPLSYQGNCNGDLLIHHLIFRRMVEAPALVGAAGNYPWEFWYDNPLNRGYHFLACERRPAEPEIWSALLDEDFLPFLPWIIREWAQHWSECSSERWSTELLDRWNVNHALLCRELLELLPHAERPDLLAGLLPFFHRLAQEAPADRARYEEWSARRSHANRDARTIPWASYLAVASEIQDLYQGFTRLHPVERSDSQKLLMALYQTSGFAQVVESLSELRSFLRPSLS